MSLFGAVRMYVTARQDEARLTEPDELPPLVEGRWAAWARSRPADGTAGLRPGAACVTPDGRPGHVAASFDGTDWTYVCEAG